MRGGNSWQCVVAGIRSMLCHAKEGRLTVAWVILLLLTAS